MAATAIIDSREAQRSALEYQRGFNSSREIPERPAIVQAASDAARVYVFNIGPWTHVRELGSSGRYQIHACPEGKEYNEPIVLEGLESEPYPVNESEMAMKPKCGKPRQIAGEGGGYEMAQLILGEGRAAGGLTNYAPFGVFISKTPVPAKAELEKAKKLLNQKYTELVQYAMACWAKGPAAQAEIFNQPEWYFVAARKLNKTETECPFLANSQVPAARDTCGNCGTPYQIGIAQCAKCGSVLDEEKYISEERRKALIRKRIESAEASAPKGANAIVK